MINYGLGVLLGWTSHDDRERFFHWRNNHAIWKWCRQNGPITYGQHSAYWHSVDHCDDKKFFSIVTVGDRIGSGGSKMETVGCAGLTSIDNINKTAEFSLYIGPEHQRRGYAKAALKTLITYGFSYLNLNCIWGETFAGNPALKMFLDIGMREEGLRRQFYYRNGKYLDAHLISVLREEWTA